MIPGFTFVDHFAGPGSRGHGDGAPRLLEWDHIELLPGKIAGDLAREIGQPLAVRTPSRNPPSPVVGARIVMIEAASRRVLTVTVTIGESSARALVAHNLGAADADTISGFAAELANLAAGAVKRWAPARAELTFGLPRTFEGSQPSGPSDLTFDMFDGPIGLRCMLHLRAATSTTLSVRGLEEGMVLASDVRSEGGQRLLFGGQRLTSSTIQLLREGPGRNLRFDVIDGS